MKTVYLYGPIAGLTYQHALAWRAWMAGQLDPHKIRVLDPLRGKQHLASLGQLSGHGRDYDKSMMDAASWPLALAHPRAILSRDKADVLRADMIAGNFLHTAPGKVSIGSLFEQAWAHMAHKPVAVAAPATDHPHDHVFFNSTVDIRVSTLEELRDVIIQVLG